MSEYPKTLHHPAFSAGKPAKPLNAVQLANGETPEPGVPCRYPPVTVKTAKDEDYHRAMGYMAQEESHVFAGYSDYPKMMVHPDHVDAVPEEIDAKRDENGAIIRIVKPGGPEKFPHVFVKDADEEAAWTKKGWELPGKADPQTASDLRVDHIEGYQAQLYPAMVDGKVIDPNAAKGGPDRYPMWLHGQIVNNYAEEMALCDPKILEKQVADDKAKRIAELMAELAELSGARLEPEADPRPALLAEAKERGIKVHHKWSIDRLQEALKAA